MVIDRGGQRDALTTPSEPDCLAFNRQGVLSPSQRERLAVFIEALAEVAAIGFTLGGKRGPTRADLEADLAEGTVLPVDGEVSWVRGADLDSYAGQWRLRDAGGRWYGLNGQSLPGRARGYVVPRYGLVVGIEPIADRAGALGRYRQVLAVALGLGHEDFDANRQGRVGPRQRAFVRAGSLGALGLILLGLAILAGILAFGPATLGTPGSDLASGKYRDLFVVVTLVLGLPALFLVLRSYCLAPRGTVSSRDGVVTRMVAWSKRYEVGESVVETASNERTTTAYRRMFLDVGGERFDAQHLVDRRAASAIVLGLPHRVFFEQRTRAIVALEPLSAP